MSILKKRTFFFGHFGSTLELKYMKLLFENQEKNAPFWILGDELGCVFFFGNIVKTHLNSSLKIVQNIPLFSCPFQKNAPFFLVILGIDIGIEIYETFFFKIKKKTHLL